MAKTANAVPLIYLSSSGSDGEDSKVSEEQRDDAYKRRRVERRNRNVAKPDRCNGKNKTEPISWDDASTRLLLKLVVDDAWSPKMPLAVNSWDRVVLAFNNHFPRANATKNTLKAKLFKEKRNYKDLKKFLESSGLEWDHTKNMVSGAEKVWQKLLRTNKHARKWQNNPMPYYSVIEELFCGKSVDRKQSTCVGDSRETVITQQASALRTSTRHDDGSPSNHVKIEETQKDSPPTRPSPTSAVPSSFIDPNKRQKSPSPEPSKIPAVFDSCFMSDFTGKPSDMKKAERTCVFPGQREFSIKLCMEAFYMLKGFEKEDILQVGEVFKAEENRELFLSLREEDRELWLRGQLDAF